MIEAMLAIDSPEYQRIYRACGDGERTGDVIDVRGPASLLFPQTTCPGRRFALLRDRPEVRGPVVRLDVSSIGTSWTFQASQYEPNPTEVEEGVFESTQSFCSAVGGFVEWTGERWRTFVDVDRALSARKP